MEGPQIQVASTGAQFALQLEVTTVGRGNHVDVRLEDPSVSLLHAELVRRGPYVYVMDLGLSRNGTRVNGRLVARRLLSDGDALSFGSARCRISGIATDEHHEPEQLRSSAPELTRREMDVISSLCRPALSEDAFVAPATAREIAADLVVTEAAVKQHLLRLYTKLRIPEGTNRRIRLANEVIALGLARPELPGEPNGARMQSPPSHAPPAHAPSTHAPPPHSQPLHSQPARAQPAQAQPPLHQPPPAKPTPAKPTPAKPTSGQPTAAKPTPAQPKPALPVPRQSGPVPRGGL